MGLKAGSNYQLFKKDLIAFSFQIAEFDLKKLFMC